jgi:hypothetical protein
MSAPESTNTSEKSPKSDPVERSDRIGEAVLKSAIVVAILIPVAVLFGGFLLFYYAFGAFAVFDITPVGVVIGVIVVLMLGWALHPLMRSKNAQDQAEDEREP